MSIDNLKPSLIQYIIELAKKNLVNQQKKEIYAKLLLQKLSELVEKIEDHSNKSDKSFLANFNTVLQNNIGDAIDGSAQ